MRWATIRTSLLAIATALSLSSVAAAQTEPNADQPPSRAQLCRQLSSGSNPFFGAEGHSGPRPLADDTAKATLALAWNHLQRGRFTQAQKSVEALFGSSADHPGAAQTPSVEERTEGHWIAGLASLRVGEVQNCFGEHQSHPPESELDSSSVGLDAPRAVCILPLRSNAVHKDPAPARTAFTHFREVLNAQPRNPTAAWLANLAATLAGSPGLVEERYALSLTATNLEDLAFSFVNRARALGTDTTDLAGGAALEDFDGDGRLDLVTSTWDPCGGLRAFRNLGGLQFADTTAQWGLDGIAGGLNLFTGDYDNDGHTDLFVTRGAWLLQEGRISNSLLRNEVDKNGQPSFRDVTVETHLAAPAAPTQAAVFRDFDNDGYLDLFVANEATSGSPHGSQLFLNRAHENAKDDGPRQTRRFLDHAEAAAVLNYRYAKAVAAGDVDNDGDQDLYVSNFGLNRLYLNQLKESGKLVFEDRADQLGVTEPAVQSFATWFFDFDHDGDLDLFVADYQQQPDRVAASYFPADSWIGRTLKSGGQPLLYKNLLIEDGALAFVEIGASAGITRPAMPMGANFGDFDNDGNLDLYLGTGEPNLASQFPNQAYRNNGSTFEEITFTSGLGHLQKGHGIAFGDVDGDGDQDLLHQLGGFYPGDTGANALFENRSQEAAHHHWITLHLVGRSANRSAIGAKVRVFARRHAGERHVADESVNQAPRQESKIFHHTVDTGGSFGANSLQLEVGLGAFAEIDKIEVDWPGTKTETFRGLVPGTTHRLVEGDSVGAETDPNGSDL